MKEDKTETKTITEFFSGRFVLITGATGFIGQVLLEKLLRSCSDLATIYILTRPKRGKGLTERLEHIFSTKLFAPLLANIPDCREKVVPIQGDITEPYLGISLQDRAILKEKVSVVINLAAAISFTMPFSQNLRSNVGSVVYLLQLCQEMTSLVSLVHISTAYSNSDLKEIDERIYPLPFNPETIWKFNEECHSELGEELLEEIGEKLKDSKPNTYTLTKAMGEEILSKSKLPFVICRPSIVGNSAEEPFPGWTSGEPLSAYCLIFGERIIPTIYGDENTKLDYIPVDLLCKQVIAAAWFKAVNPETSPVVYNVCTSNYFNWIPVVAEAIRYYRNPLGSTPVPERRHTNSRARIIAETYVRSYLPAWLYDRIMALRGKPTKFAQKVQKSLSLILSYETFLMTSWSWRTSKTEKLLSQLLPADKRDFNFDCRSLDPLLYLKHSMYGAQAYLLGRDMGKVKQIDEEAESSVLPLIDLWKELALL